MTRFSRVLAAGADERGFTMVEVLVTLTVLAIGIFTTGQVFSGSLQADSSAASRSRATALASRETEAMHAVPYAALGLATGSISESTYEGLNIVFSDPGSTAPSGPDVTIGGVVFSINRYIVWLPNGGNSTAYKRTTAVVSWTDRIGRHDVRQDSVVYPGGLGPYGGATTSTSSTTTTTSPTLCTPTSLSAVADPLLPSSQVDLGWSCGGVAPQYWEIQHALDPAFTNALTEDTNNQPGASTSYIRTALASSTTYYFRIRTLSGGQSGPWTMFPPVSTHEADTCTLGSFNATPSAIRRADGSSGHLSGDVSITIHSAVGDQCGVLRLSFNPDGSSPTGVTLSLNSGTGVYSTTIYANDYRWSVGTKNVSVLNGVGATVGSIALVVCDENAKSCP